MRTTGIVRRVDDLGRIVIPREIRKMLKIADGEPLEIYVNGKDEVIFKKYQHDNLIDISKTIVKTLNDNGIVASMYNRDGEKIEGEGVHSIDIKWVDEVTFPIPDKELCDFNLGYIIVNTIPNEADKIIIETLVSMASHYLS